jgi:hypothetical protein
MFDQHDELRGNDGPEPERHVVLVADSSPHLTGCRCNANEQYDNYSLGDVSQELLKVIRLSHIPKMQLFLFVAWEWFTQLRHSCQRHEWF